MVAWAARFSCEMDCIFGRQCPRRISKQVEGDGYLGFVRRAKHRRGGEFGGKTPIFSVNTAHFYHENAFEFADLGLEIPKRRMENALRKQEMMRMVGGMKTGRSQLRTVIEWAGMSRQLGLAMGSLQPLGKQLVEFAWDVGTSGNVQARIFIAAAFGWGDGSDRLLWFATGFFGQFESGQNAALSK